MNQGSFCHRYKEVVQGGCYSEVSVKQLLEVLWPVFPERGVLRHKTLEG